MKPEYWIRQHKGKDDVWHGPFNVIPKNKLKSLTERNDYDNFTVYKCQKLPIDLEKL